MVGLPVYVSTFCRVELHAECADDPVVICACRCHLPWATPTRSYPPGRPDAVGSPEGPLLAVEAPLLPPWDR